VAATLAKRLKKHLDPPLAAARAESVTVNEVFSFAAAIDRTPQHLAGA
jgi:hypothetical protein